MGAEAKCIATVDGKKVEGKALLETDELIFRGKNVRLLIPYKSISRIDAKDGVLHVTWRDGTAAFELGPAAVKWADKIRNPPSRIEQTGCQGRSAGAVCRPARHHASRRDQDVRRDRPRARHGTGGCDRRR